MTTEIIVTIAFTLVGLILILYYVPIGIYFHAIVSGVRITLVQLILMQIRKVPPAIIVNALIRSQRNALKIRRDELEAAYLAGADLDNITKGMITAQHANLKLTFKDAVSKDLAGFNIPESIKRQVQSRKS